MLKHDTAAANSCDSGKEVVDKNKTTRWANE